MRPVLSIARRYISNTKVKLVLVMAMSVNNFKDDELIAVRPHTRTVLQQTSYAAGKKSWLHDVYVTVCMPCGVLTPCSLTLTCVVVPWKPLTVWPRFLIG